MLINGIDVDLIFLSLAGSHLYGTNTPNSDVDVRGVCFSPVDKLLGLEGFEQYDFSQKTRIEVILSNIDKPSSVMELEKREEFWSRYKVYSEDITIYSLQKFAKLCLDGNPNIVELLFSNSLLYGSIHISVWGQLFRHRKYFLSQKVRHTFSGYAFSQLKRIKVYTEWMNKPPEKPDPKDFGIVQEDDGGYIWTNSSRKNQYDNLLKQYQHYTEWLNNRNPKRRELEEQFGYDTKHASHLVRLILEGVELLSTGNITLPLKDEVIKQVMDVRAGKMDYEELLKESERGFDWLKNMPSVLPQKPDRKRINELIIEIELDRLKYAVEQ